MQRLTVIIIPMANVQFHAETGESESGAARVVRVRASKCNGIFLTHSIIQFCDTQNQGRERRGTVRGRAAKAPALSAQELHAYGY